MTEIVRGQVTIIEEGVKADVIDLTNNNGLAVAILDGAGNQVTSFGGSGGTSATDDASFTAGSGSGTPMMAFATSDAVNAGDVGVVAMDTARNLKVSIEADNVGIGGGVQYTEGDTDASLTGMVVMWEDGSDTVVAASAAKPLPVGDAGGSLTIDASSLPLPTGASTSAKQDTIISHVDGVEGLLTTIDSDTGTIAGAVSGSEMQVDVVTSALPTGAATGAKQDDQTTALQLIDDVVYADDADWTDDTSKHALVGGVYQATPHTVTDGDVTPFLTDVNGRLAVSLPAGDNNIGNVDIASIAAGDNNIGNVDVVTLPNVTLAAGTNTNEVVGDAADDAAAAGNPVRVGGYAISPDGTDPGSVSAEGDAAALRTDLNRRLLVNTYHPRTLTKHLNGSSAYTDESIAADPGDGFQIIITNIIASTGAATALNFFLEEGSTTIFGPIYLEAVAGRGFCSGPIYLPVSASTAVTLTSSAAIAQSYQVQYHIQAV